MDRKPMPNQNEMDIKLVQFCRKHPEFSDWVESDDCEISSWPGAKGYKYFKAERDDNHRRSPKNQFNAAGKFADEFHDEFGREGLAITRQGTGNRFGFYVITVEKKKEGDESGWNVDVFHNSFSKLKEQGIDKFAKNARDEFVKENPELILKLAKGDIEIEFSYTDGYVNGENQSKFTEKAVDDTEDMRNLQALKKFRSWFLEDQYSARDLILAGVKSVYLYTCDKHGAERFAAGVKRLQSMYANRENDELLNNKFQGLENAVVLKQAREMERV
jgi:hypothetical protein